MTETARRILDEALKAFSRYGYRAANVGDIAEASGVSRQALYKHFADKDELFKGVVDDLHATTLAAAEAAMTQAAAQGPAAILHAQLERRYGPFQDHFHNTPHGAELVSEWNRLCGPRNTQATARFTDILTKTIKQEAKAGRLDLDHAPLKPGELAELLIRGVYGLKSREPSPLSPTEFRLKLKHMVGLLIASLTTTGKRK